MAEHPRSARERRRLRARENRYRDVWLLAISVIVVLMLASSARNQARNTKALCALRTDLQARVSSGKALLITHPDGIPGISVPTIRSSIANERATVRALRTVSCPARTPAIHH